MKAIASLDAITQRKFKMGFSTWSFDPNEVNKDVGKLWGDTGLLDKNGAERPAFAV